MIRELLRQNERKELDLAGPSNAGGRSRAIVGPVVCVVCGGTIADVLSRLGSTRCHDCRDGVRPAQDDSVRVNGTGRAGPSAAWALLLRVRTRQRGLARRRNGDTHPRR
jgi:hypothetical protein